MVQNVSFSMAVMSDGEKTVSCSMSKMYLGIEKVDIIIAGVALCF
jgi:hypothetical protein